MSPISRAPVRIPSGRRHAGFTLVELLVVLAIISVILAFIAYQAVSGIGKSQATAISQSMDAVTEAVMDYREHVGRYPSQLNHLTTDPAAPADLCGRTVPAVMVARWAGPYLQRDVTSSGFKAGDATVLNALLRVPSVAPATPRADTLPGSVFVQAAAVDSAVAVEVDLAFDGVNNFSSGAVRWTTAGEDTLSFGIPIVGC